MAKDRSCPAYKSLEVMSFAFYKYHFLILTTPNKPWLVKKEYSPQKSWDYNIYMLCLSDKSRWFWYIKYLYKFLKSIGSPQDEFFG